MGKIIFEDVIGNGVVNINDLVYVANYYSFTISDSNRNETVNISKDEDINIVDLIIVTKKLDCK